MLKRRKRERAIADELTTQLTRNITSTEHAPPELMAHHFGLVCQRFNFMPDEASASRILNLVATELMRRKRSAALLSKAIKRATPR